MSTTHHSQLYRATRISPPHKHAVALFALPPRTFCCLECFCSACAHGHAHTTVVRCPSVLSVRRACSVRVRTICERGVCIHLLEVSSDATLGAATARFVSPYPPGDAATRLIQPVLLARGALLLLERLSCDAGSSQLPEVLISNDWVACEHCRVENTWRIHLIQLTTTGLNGVSCATALCAPYARHTAWAGSAAPAVSALGQKCLFVCSESQPSFMIRALSRQSC
jgi:hypothetical protein